MELILKWRSTCPEALRTTFSLTLENQLDFYNNVVANRNSNARWWGIYIDKLFSDEMNSGIEELLIGYCAIENISWENRNGEISLLIDPQYHGKGYGKQAVEILLDKGFNFLNLDNIYGECYFSNHAISFWEKIIKQYNGSDAILPNRKYFNGQYYNALYFSINKDDYKHSLIKYDNIQFSECEMNNCD
jgi:RimJ/RimL family protein N-acetyltransferase